MNFGFGRLKQTTAPATSQMPPNWSTTATGGRILPQQPSAPTPAVSVGGHKGWGGLLSQIRPPQASSGTLGGFLSRFKR